MGNWERRFPDVQPQISMTKNNVACLTLQFTLKRKLYIYFFKISLFGFPRIKNVLQDWCYIKVSKDRILILGVELRYNATTSSEKPYCFRICGINWERGHLQHILYRLCKMSCCCAYDVHCKHVHIWLWLKPRFPVFYWIWDVLHKLVSSIVLGPKYVNYESHLSLKLLWAPEKKKSSQ